MARFVPLSEPGALRQFRKVFPERSLLHMRSTHDAALLACFVEVRPGIAVLTPRFNGNQDHDREALHAFLGTGTIKALLDIASVDREASFVDVAQVAAAREGHVEAVLALNGWFFDARRQVVQMDSRALIPVHARDFELLAAVRYAELWPGSRVRANVVLPGRWAL